MDVETEMTVAIATFVQTAALRSERMCSEIVVFSEQISTTSKKSCDVMIDIFVGRARIFICDCLQFIQT